MKRLLNIIAFILFTVPVGFIAGSLTFSLIMLGVVKIRHWERFPFWRRKLIVVSNHPSLLETVLVPALFFPEYCLNPFFYIPWSTPDRKNFYDRWYWSWARTISVPIDRTDERNGAEALHKIKDLLNRKKIVVLFAEGGRTFKGDKFRYSAGGKRLRELKRTVGFLVARTGAEVLPIWVEGADKVLLNHHTKLYGGIYLRQKVTIKIGKLIRARKSLRIGSSREITERITKLLLELADEKE